MSIDGMKESEVLGPFAWPKENWTDHFEFVTAQASPDSMGEAEGTLVSFLDVQQLDHLRADIAVERLRRGAGFRVRLHLVGRVVRRCALTGQLLREEVDVKDRFEFMQPPRRVSAPKKLEAKISEDLGTGLEEGPDIWDEKHPPTLVGLIADTLDDALEPFPKVPDGEVATQFAQDPDEAAQANKMHPFAALKALKKEA